MASKNPYEMLNALADLFITGKAHQIQGTKDLESFLFTPTEIDSSEIGRSFYTDIDPAFYLDKSVLLKKSKELYIDQNEDFDRSEREKIAYTNFYSALIHIVEKECNDEYEKVTQNHTKDMNENDISRDRLLIGAKHLAYQSFTFLTCLEMLQSDLHFDRTQKIIRTLPNPNQHCQD